VLHFVWRPHHYDAVAFILPDGKETVLVEAGAHREAVDELMKNVRLLHQLDANKAEEERTRRAAPGQAGSGDPQKQSDAGGGRNSVPPSTPKTRKVVKFKDDLSDSSSPERATKLCRFFQDGKECKYGLRCKFRHDRQPDPSDLDARLKKLEQQSQQDPRSRVEAIKDQVKAKRKKGICRVHAAGGRCRYGDNCKFEHSVGKLDGQNSAESMRTDIAVPGGATAVSHIQWMLRKVRRDRNPRDGNKRRPPNLPRLLHETPNQHSKRDHRSRSTQNFMLVFT
jgi:hypothetical protein